MINPYWFVLPLIVAISLVYSASRHESWPRIQAHAQRLCLTFLTVFLVAIAVLLAINNFLL